MKRFKYITLSLITALALLGGFKESHAAIFNPGSGSGSSAPGTGSVTFNGITTSTLNINGSASITVVSSTGANGAANVTISSSGGGASSTNVFGTSPIVVTQSGINATTSCPTCLVTPSSATSSVIISNLNNIQYVPSNFATAGCAGSSTATTFQGCVYAIYASMASIGGGTIWITNDVTSTWTGLLSFNINGDQVSLNCTANTILQYTGTSTTNSINAGWLPSGQNIALNFDFGNPVGHAQTSDSGGCDLRGNPSLIVAGQANTATSTGIWNGGTWSYTSASHTASTTNAGAVGVNIDYNINGFGRNIGYGANTYLDEFGGTSSGGNCGNVLGCLLFFSIAQNSGERWVMQGGSYTDPGNSNPNNAIYLTNAGTASIFFNYNSIDDAIIVCGASDGQCDVSENHIENPDGGQYGAYIPIQNPSSDRSTSINASFEEFANDFSGANSFSTLIKHGGQLTAIGDHIDNYGGGTITNFSDHSNDNGVESEMICMLQVQGGGLTNIVAGGGNITYSLATGNGCIYDNANSYPIEMLANQSNINNIQSGNVIVATFDHNGNWTFPSASSTSFLFGTTSGGQEVQFDDPNNYANRDASNGYTELHGANGIEFGYGFSANNIAQTFTATSTVASGTLTVSGATTLNSTLSVGSNLTAFNQLYGNPVVATVSSTLTGSSPFYQVFSGTSTATYSLVSISSHNGYTIIFRNRGTASVTINTNSGSDFLDLLGNTTSTSYTLNAGSSTAFFYDSSFINQMWAQ